MSFTKYGKLGIPNQLVDAQEKGTLVVFAGAGVSMDSPASLPDFLGLVKQVCNVLPYQDSEPLERVLGRHSDAQVDVHALTKAFFEKEMAFKNSGCTKLHKIIPRLFRRDDPTSIRIVTTNFDTYLSRTIPNNVKIYSAPALPLNAEFNGLVHLHGSIKGDAHSLVLNDKDFSKAYMTEGWAREFILNLYENYTVLFIGYSHEDQLISYLARGMNLGAKNVYAFSGDSERELENWGHLGITAIPFPHRDFKLLSNGINRWADEIQSNYFKRKERFTKIVEYGIPLSDSEAEGFLKKYIMTPGYTEIFTRSTHSSAWCKWIVDNRLADFIHEEVKTIDHFSVSKSWDGSKYLLGNWLAKQFVRDIGELNRSLKQHGHGLSWPLTSALINSLSRDNASSEIALGYLCTLLLTQCSHVLIFGSHTPLIDVCFKNGAYNVALIVLRELLKPRIGMGLYFPDSTKDVNIDVGSIEFYFSSSMLFQYCLEEGKEFTEAYSREIFDLCIDSLRSVEEIKYCVVEENPFSWVEVRDVKHSENSSHGSLAVIAYLAVECIQNMHKFGQIPNSISLASYLLESQSPIIRRIAVHLVTVAFEVDETEKMNWLLDNNLLFSYPEYHEVFLLIAKFFYEADEETQSTFCTFLTDSFLEKLTRTKGDTDAYLLDYYIHLAYYLTECFSDSRVLKENYCIAQEKSGVMPTRLSSPEYPTDWRETEEFFKSEFQSKPIDELMQLAGSLSGDVKIEYLSQLMIAIQRDTQKSLEALKILSDNTDDPDVDVTRAVLGSLAAHGISSDQKYLEYLDFFKSAKLLAPFHISVIYSVNARGRSYDPIPGKCLLIEFKICRTFWEAVKSHSVIDSPYTLFDLNTALSFMSSALCRIVAESEDEELTRDVLQYLEEISDCREECFLSLFRGLGRDLFRLFEHKSDWAESYLIPFFSPSRSSHGVARSLWEGFFSIVNGRHEEMRLLQSALIESMKEKLISTDSRNFHQMVLKRLFSIYSPELMDAMVTGSDDKGLCLVVILIRDSEELGREFEHYWDEWVRAYLLGRLNSQVKPLQPMEFSEILIFAIENPTVYGELCTELNAYSGDFAKRSGDFIKACRSSGFHLKNPDIASKYLSRMVSASEYSIHKTGKQIVNFVEEILHKEKKEFEALLPVLELCGMRGVPEAKVVYDKYVD